jgi:hypothetical protein
MASYLIFGIVYCCQFPQLTISKRVNCETDPVTFWYQELWRHKSPLYFYEVYNDFVSVFKRLLLGENTSRIYDQANKFLEKRGTIKQMENHNIIRIFYSKENLVPSGIRNYGDIRPLYIFMKSIMILFQSSRGSSWEIILQGYLTRLTDF